MLGNERHPGYESQLNAAEGAARRLGLSLAPMSVRESSDFQSAFATIARSGSDALLVFTDSQVVLVARPIAEFAVQYRRPSICAWPSHVEQGNLLSYGPNERDFHHRAAVYLDRILRGADPAELPVELPTRFELTLNQRTAGALGLVLPRSVLLRADQVID